MNVHSLKLGGMQNFVHLIEDTDTQRMAVIDPAWDVAAILRAAGGASITDVFVSHWHEDHTNGIDELVAATGARIHALATETDYWGVRLDNGAELVRHDDGDRVMLGKLAIRMLHTPGHSPGSACLHADGALFTGDTLFVYGCGRCDLPGGDARALYYSLRRLQDTFALETLVYPGHDYAHKPVSTLGEQIQTNPFLHQNSVDDFVAFRAEHNRHRLPPYLPVIRGETAW
ncbi:MAG TPA: MBL fold metallo-hydrolase [Gammaproteobacteria bacterium]